MRARWTPLRCRPHGVGGIGPVCQCSRRLNGVVQHEPNDNATARTRSALPLKCLLAHRAQLNCMSSHPAITRGSSPCSRGAGFDGRGLRRMTKNGFHRASMIGQSLIVMLMVVLSSSPAHTARTLCPTSADPPLIRPGGGSVAGGRCWLPCRAEGTISVGSAGIAARRRSSVNCRRSL